MKRIPAITLLLLLWAAPAMAATGDPHRFGGGANYWVTLEDIEFDDKKVDEDGISYLISYQFWPSLLGVELDLELLPDRFGETALAPQAYVLFGRAVYVGAGIGIIYSDSDFAEEPFFALRAGLNLELLPGFYADINANYRFNDSAELDDEERNIDTDTVFLGAAVRIAF
jgi:hypothetical protein